MRWIRTYCLAFCFLFCATLTYGAKKCDVSTASLAPSLRTEVSLSRQAERDLKKIESGRADLLARAKELLQAASDGPRGMQAYVSAHPGAGYKRMKGFNNQYEVRLNGGYRAVWREDADPFGRQVVEFLGFNKDLTHR